MKLNISSAPLSSFSSLSSIATKAKQHFLAATATVFAQGETPREVLEETQEMQFTRPKSSSKPPFYTQEEIDSGLVQPLIPVFPEPCNLGLEGKCEGKPGCGSETHGDPFPHDHANNPIPAHKREHLLPSVIVEEEKITDEEIEEILDLSTLAQITNEFFGADETPTDVTICPFEVVDENGRDTVKVPFLAAQPISIDDTPGAPPRPRARSIIELGGDDIFYRVQLSHQNQRPPSGVKVG